MSDEAPCGFAFRRRVSVFDNGFFSKSDYPARGDDAADPRLHASWSERILLFVDRALPAGRLSDDLCHSDHAGCGAGDDGVLRGDAARASLGPDRRRSGNFIVQHLRHVVGFPRIRARPQRGRRCARRSGRDQFGARRFAGDVARQSDYTKANPGENPILSWP